MRRRGGGRAFKEMAGLDTCRPDADVANGACVQGLHGLQVMQAPSEFRCRFVAWRR